MTTINTIKFLNLNILSVCRKNKDRMFFFAWLFNINYGLYCGAGVFGQIGCQSLSPRLALPTFTHDNNNKNICATSRFYISKHRVTEASRASQRLYCTQLMVQSVALTPLLTTRDRELISVLEDKIQPRNQTRDP